MEDDLLNNDHSEQKVIHKKKPGVFSVVFIVLGMFTRLFMLYISFPLYFDGESLMKGYITVSIVIEAITYIGIVLNGPTTFNPHDIKSKNAKIMKEKNTGRYIRDPVFLFPFSNDWICYNNSNIFLIYIINTTIGYITAFKESLRLLRLFSDHLCSIKEWKYWFGLSTLVLCFFWMPYLYDLCLYFIKVKILKKKTCNYLF